MTGPQRLKGKTIFITGASRGIGLAIALRAARDGANIAIAAKTVASHAKLPGTIYTAADEVRAAGGQALPLQVDIRDGDQIKAAVDATVAEFGGIDVLINNASAISLTGTLETPLRRYDLMHQVNGRGTFAVSQACIPYLKQASDPHILMMAPPLNMNPRWFGPHLAYTISKYNMSLCVLGLAEELKPDAISVNALWPRSVIATAALNLIPGIDTQTCRTPEIVADAAYALLSGAAGVQSGQFLLDEDVLTASGVTDFSGYSVNEGRVLTPDLFLD